MTGTTKRILLISNDLPPTPGVPVSGGGLRVNGLQKGLESKGHEVIISVPSVKLEGLSARAAARFQGTAFRHDRLSRVIHSVAPELIIVEQWALANFLEEIDVPLVIDLHGSLIMENQFRRHRDFRQNATAKVKALNKADLVTCAGEIQRRYFMSWLVLSGFQPEDLAVESIPNLLGPSVEPQRKPTRTHTWLFGGAAWPWVDPFPALAVAAEQLQGRPGHQLKLFYGTPENRKVLPHDTTGLPNPNLERYLALASDNVIASPLISHARFINECRTAYVALDVFQRNAERELAFTTRTSEYLWAGLPVIHAHYDELGAWIREYSAGWVVDPDDEASLRTVIEEVLDNPEEVERRATNARRLANDRLTWERGIEPLHRFCVDPRIRSKSPPLFKRLSLDIARLEEKRDRETEEHERAIGARDGTIASLKIEIEGRDRTIYDLNQEIKSLSSSTEDAIRKEQNAAEEKLGLTERQRVIALERAAAAERRTEHLDEKLRVEVSGRDEHIFRLRKELETLREESSTKEQALTREVSAIQGELAASKERVEGLTRERDERTREVARLEHEGAASKARWEERLRDLHTEVRAARQEKSRLEAQLCDKLGELAAANERRAALEGENNSLRGESQRTQAALEHAKMEISEIQDRILTRLEDRLTFLVQRAGVQVPELLSALVKNSRNNLYLQLWERMAKKKVFPGT